ncbi:hypothetical protein RI570_20045 [Brucella pseudogrignonensis]|jgi:hypothetical protein|uniref:hypothetical protein n=1 Tax=Brucella pseudogrignonensis TaxID=419475 RepID=UPI002020B392|nr:hypothetical protein [Brucella pseudogrignonensis]MCL7999785.1 hypothetical protein [Brucella sp. 21LCYQ03]MDT6942363.1 hypothetical protein [Brucella pseudogrignonensis]
MSDIIRTELEHIKAKIQEIKTKIHARSEQPDHEREQEDAAIRMQLNDMVGQINAILPH